jgi:hypothetical protein
MSIVVEAAEETDEDRDADGVVLSCCKRRSNGDGRRSGSRAVSGLFRFLEMGFSLIDLYLS